MNPHTSHHYQDGPTTCLAHPDVVNSIQKQIKSSGALSTADIRLGRRMGLIGTERILSIGLNDGVIIPPSQALQTRVRGMAPVRAAMRAPTAGPRKLHALALLVDFKDNKGQRPASDFQTMLFDPANPNSMTSIYREMSFGALEVTGEVAGYVRAPKPYSYYTAGESGMGDAYPKNTPGLLFDALTKFCEKDSLKRFDVDGDGFVDGIFLIHAGGGAEAEPDPAKRPKMIWSHKWVLPTAFVNKSVSVYAYSTEPEDGRVGVFSHEFGHVLGLPDLYDTSYRSKGIGDWCLMSGGSWGGGGDKPTRMSCWCLSQLGWINPKNVAKSSKPKALKLAPLAQQKGHCHRLASGGAAGSEYFLLEHRPKSGRDAELPAGGLLVWHIDEKQSGNTNPLSYKVGLVQADGKRDLEFSRNDGDDGDPFPGSKNVRAINDATTPSTRANDGTPTGIALSEIALSASPVLATLKAKV